MGGRVKFYESQGLTTNDIVKSAMQHTKKLPIPINNLRYCFFWQLNFPAKKFCILKRGKDRGQLEMVVGMCVRTFGEIILPSHILHVCTALGALIKKNKVNAFCLSAAVSTFFVGCIASFAISFFMFSR